MSIENHLIHYCVYNDNFLHKMTPLKYPLIIKKKIGNLLQQFFNNTNCISLFN